MSTKNLPKSKQNVVASKAFIMFSPIFGEKIKTAKQINE